MLFHRLVHGAAAAALLIGALPSSASAVLTEVPRASTEPVSVQTTPSDTATSVTEAPEEPGEAPVPATPDPTSSSTEVPTTTTEQPEEDQAGTAPSTAPTARSAAASATRFQVSGAIGTYWALHATTTGQPTGAETRVAGGTYQRFTKGVVY